MIINASNGIEVHKAKERFKWLIDNCKTFELTEKKKARTYKQNRYLHLIISWFGLELGYTISEAKMIYKKLNLDLYKYVKNNSTFLRSSTELNTKQMTISIEKFRNYANSELGIYLTEANEVKYLNHIEQEINKYNSKVHL